MYFKDNPTDAKGRRIVEEIEKYNQKQRKTTHNTYLKNREARERAKKKFKEIAHKIAQYVRDNISQGDIIQCKGYRGVKKVVEIKGYSVFAMCGWYSRGEFMPNGSGSETYISYVTEVLRDGKWLKIKDLINKS